MTKSKNEYKTDIKKQDIHYGLPELKITRLELVEDPTLVCDYTPEYPNYPENLPENNVEATIYLMKQKEKKA